MSSLLKLLQEKVFLPTVLVITDKKSEGLQALCRSNGLEDLSQLLNLCLEPLPIDTIKTVRFISDSDMNVAAAHMEDPISMSIPPLSSFKFKHPLTWFNAYRDQYLMKYGGVRLSESDTFLHPVACIVAAFTTDPHPIETLTHMQISFPPYVDPNPLRIYLLIDPPGSGVEYVPNMRLATSFMS